MKSIERIKRLNIYKRRKLNKFSNKINTFPPNKDERVALDQTIPRIKSLCYIRKVPTYLKDFASITNSVKVEARCSQYEIFHKTMKRLILCGQLVGLNPICGFWDRNVSRLRVEMFSIRFFYSIFIAFAQGTTIVLCLNRYLRYEEYFLDFLATMSFNVTTFLTTITFFRVARTWAQLSLKILNSSLDEYADPTVTVKCKIAAFVLVLFGVCEHILSEISNLEDVIICVSENDDVYQQYVSIKFQWVFNVVPYNFFLAIFVQIFTAFVTINWNYSDLFIIYIGFYLSSMFEKINEKIHNNLMRYNRPKNFWRCIREDYVKATGVVSYFDHSFGSLIFISFASNLFFICVQLYYVLSRGVKYLSNDSKNCSNPNGVSILGGYEYAIYYTFSLIFVSCRFLAACLAAAQVHTASLKPKPALYGVSSENYDVEVQRFLDQLQDDKVALTGLQYFSVTKNIVLTVAGVVVTYELVLVQFYKEKK